MSRVCDTCGTKVKEDGRCWNTNCICYSNRVLAESFEDGNLKCDGYGVRCESMKATRRRQNTKYVEEESNWNTLCEDCQIKVDEYWADMWADYYSGIL